MKRESSSLCLRRLKPQWDSCLTACSPWRDGRRYFELSPVSPELKQLVAYISSTAAGCRYCQAHTADSAARIGVPQAKLEAAWNFESDTGFEESERAVLRLARDASVVPNAVTKAHFEDLHKYFSDDEIVELVAVISLFGWLNRWNDTMATELESEPLNFASKHLASRGWAAGKHHSG